MSNQLDSWGCVTPENYNQKKERNKKYKPFLMELVKITHQILLEYSKKSNIKWFLMDGSLLGAYRNNKMVEHDYDFDFGIYYYKNKMPELAEFLNDELKKHNQNYVCVFLNGSYATKLEIYDPTHGTHWNKGDDWYNVIMDLQLYIDHPHDNKLLQVQYTKDDFMNSVKFKKEYFFPLSKIKFEDIILPCPKDPKAVLTEEYGYIGENAIFNKKTNKYEKK